MLTLQQILILTMGIINVVVIGGYIGSFLYVLLSALAHGLVLGMNHLSEGLRA